MVGDGVSETSISTILATHTFFVATRGFGSRFAPPLMKRVTGVGTKDAAKINELGSSLAKEQKLSAQLQNEVQVVSDRLAKELEAMKKTRAELKSVSEAKTALEKQLHDMGGPAV